VYAREEELLRLREVAEALEQEQYRSMLDLQTGQRHMDGLSEKVVELQSQLRLAGADSVAMKQELGSCRNVAALLERQKQELLREAALLRDEIVALRGKMEQRDVERAAQAEKLDLERRRAQEMEGVLQALRAREHASQEAERARANENVSLQDQLRKARDEAERQGQELRAVRARMEDLDYESQRRLRTCTAEGAERDGLQAEAAQMRVRLRELQEMTERQGVALEAKQEEMTQLRLRLSRMQAEAERSERHVLELETCLRRHAPAFPVPLNPAGARRASRRIRPGGPIIRLAMFRPGGASDRAVCVCGGGGAGTTTLRGGRRRRRGSSSWARHSWRRTRTSCAARCARRRTSWSGPSSRCRTARGARDPEESARRQRAPGRGDEAASWLRCGAHALLASVYPDEVGM
jgi:hypothetical protein